MSKGQKHGTVTVDGETLHLSLPFAKVDKNKSLVSGFATLDNIDSQGDIVLADASAKAFQRARGNIREMHQPLAVGRMVDFREDEYFDKDTRKTYRGVYVTARVSEGAQDTWLKVLDGTLTGFSIGGEILDADQEFNKDAGTDVRVIKDYNLVELSLVDNPANQLSNVLSIQKSASGSVMKGMVAEARLSIVYICPVDETVAIKSAETSDPCPQCGGTMEDAGWFEEGSDRADKVDEIVTKFLNPLVKEAAPISDEGGVEVGTEDVTGAEEAEVEVVEPEVEEVPAEEEVVEEVAPEEEGGLDEPPVDPDAVPDEESEISKKIDALQDAIEKTLASTKGEFSEEVEALKKFVGEQMQPIVEKTSELEEKLNGFGEKLEVNKGRLAELEARLEKMNSLDAVKKSGELDETKPETVQKNTKWSPGAFSGKADSGFFSVNDL